MTTVGTYRPRGMCGFASNEDPVVAVISLSDGCALILALCTTIDLGWTMEAVRNYIVLMTSMQRAHLLVY